VKTSGNVSIASVLAKKDTTIGVRVDDELLVVLQKLAKKDERPVASMARKLIIEALRARKLVK
jgi:predicted transcriptional regulator